jgi:hypothetical protein
MSLSRNRSYAIFWTSVSGQKTTRSVFVGSWWAIRLFILRRKNCGSRLSTNFLAVLLACLSWRCVASWLVNVSRRIWTSMKDLRLSNLQRLADTWDPGRQWTKPPWVRPIKESPQLLVLILNRGSGKPNSAKRIYFVHSLSNGRLPLLYLVTLVGNNAVPMYQVQLIFGIPIGRVSSYDDLQTARGCTLENRGFVSS